VEAELPARDLDGIVLVTAHMDSTGARQAGYRADTDPAPGADDDASGTAAVLLAAAAIHKLARRTGVPRRAIRFVLFNAEEHGLVGSRAYARSLAALGAPVVADYQMDMIGYDVLAERTFEMHSGFSASSAVQSRSLQLAQLVAALVPQVSGSLPVPQMYSDGGSDPAQGRSDHYSFQAEGYAACLACEDFFAGPGAGAPAPEPNPQYHMPTDNFVNYPYAASIARAVTAAAWLTATH
jgi:Zn-dependent M28 family amino/carboxypeptidase